MEAAHQRVWKNLLIAMGLSAGAALAAVSLHSLSGVTRVAALFLVPVVISGCMRGRQAAIMAAALCVLLYRSFLEFRVAEHTSFYEDAFNTGIFLLVALLTGTLAGRVRDAARRSEARAEAMEQLLQASRKLNDDADEDSLWGLIADSIKSVTGTDTLTLVDPTGSVRVERGSPTGEAADLARKALAGSEATGTHNWTSRQIADGTGVVGAAAWLEQNPDGEERTVRQHSTDLVLQITAAALARQRSREVRLRMETAEASGRLREALLSSISHDFRSPLAAIIGSSSSLLEYGDKFTEEVRRDLLLNIQDEAARLNDYVGNLLNMTRLQAGVLNTHLEPVSIDDAIHSARARLLKHSKTPMSVNLAGACDVLADRLLLEQAFYNVLDNALKYGNGKAGVSISSQAEGDMCRIEFADQGPGIAKDQLPTAFGKFHLTREGKAQGTGLGLSIVKGFIEAMGGTVEAQARADGASGLVIVIKLPRAI